VEFLARADAQLGEHLAQVPLDRAGNQVEPAADLRVCVSVPGQAGDLRLLRRQLRVGLARGLAHRLAGGQQLAAGARGERVGSDADEDFVGATEFLTRVQPARRSDSP
jgi:hypothetical protein